MGSTARTLTEDNAAELALWCRGKDVVEYDALDHSKTSPGINVPVGRSGVQRASLGDTIVQKNDGTFEIWRKNAGH